MARRPRKSAAWTPRSCRCPATTRCPWPPSGPGCARSTSPSCGYWRATRRRTPSGQRSSACWSGGSRSSRQADDEPPSPAGPKARMPLETSAESPVPVRTVTRLVGEWIGRLGRVWVEGQIAELSRRGGTVFLTLRDPIAAVSVRVICPASVLDATQPPPAEGARVVIWAKPEFNAARGSFALAAAEVRAVGIGELLARLERLRAELAAEGLFR